VDVCETKRILLFYLCFLVPTRIPFRRNPQSSSLKKRLTTLSGVCMCYAACQICVIRNLMLLARKEGKRKKKHFFIVCMCACMCAVLYVFPNFYFTKIDRVNLSSPLHFSFFCFELRNLKKQRVIIEMRFSFSQISCLVSWQKKPRFPPQKRKKKSIQKNTFYKKKNHSVYFFFSSKFIFFNFFGWHFFFFLNYHLWVKRLSIYFEKRKSSFQFF
jgi:hypothetical protein